MLFRKKKTYTSEEAEKLEKEFANILLEDDVEAFIKFHKIFQLSKSDIGQLLVKNSGIVNYS